MVPATSKKDTKINFFWGKMEGIGNIYLLEYENIRDIISLLNIWMDITQRKIKIWFPHSIMQDIDMKKMDSVYRNVDSEWMYSSGLSYPGVYVLLFIGHVQIRGNKCMGQYISICVEKALGILVARLVRKDILGHWKEWDRKGRYHEQRRRRKPVEYAVTKSWKWEGTNLPYFSIITLWDSFKFCLGCKSKPAKCSRFVSDEL